MMKTLALLVLFPQLCVATDFVIPSGKKINEGRLRAEARAKGFTNAEVYCKGRNKCFLQYDNAVLLDPAPVIAAHVFVDQEAVKAQEDAELRALAGKLDAGTLTDTEQKRIIRLLIRRLTGD
jgi:hypothetical protein